MAEISKTIQSFTTATEMQGMTQMLMKPTANWEDYLTPAPLSIAIMGELAVISSGTDFSINQTPPKDGFKYIQCPDSFRACLMQVCNSGWHAFNAAHKNMNQIRIHMATVPDYMKETVKILFQAPDEVIENILPNQLESIKAIADECVTLAANVEDKYIDVVNLIHELLVACTSAKHFHGEELKNIQRKMMENEMRKKSTDEAKIFYQELKETMSKRVNEANQEYKEALKSLPSGWSMNAMDKAAGITEAFMVFLHGVTHYVTKKNKEDTPTPEQNTTTPEELFSEFDIYGMSTEILSITQQIKECVTEDEIDWKKLNDPNEKKNIQWIENQFTRIIGKLKKMKECQNGKKVRKMCNKGTDICKRLAKYKPEKWDDKKKSNLVTDINGLYKNVCHFNTKAKAKSNVPAFSPKPPILHKTEKNSSGWQSTSQRATENARFRIEQSREQLKQATESYEKSLENMQKTDKEMNDILIQMQSCDIKKIDYETTMKMLGIGLNAMSRVKEQWEKMVHFFQLVSTIVHTCLSTTLHNFVQNSTGTKNIQSYSSKHFMKDLLYKQAFQASNIANLVYTISDTYTEVSNKYLMDRVSSLGRLMAMDKSTEDLAMERERLRDSCNEAKDSILKLVLKKKAEFESETTFRMAKIERELNAILPADSPEETVRIKEIVQSGFSEEELEEY